MKIKFSLKLALTVVAIAAVVFAASRLRRDRERTRVLEVFEDQASNPRLPASTSGLLKTFGRERTSEILSKAAKAHSRLIFDGDRRFAQIHHKGFFNATDYADTVVLSRVGSSIQCYWRGPIGTRIESIAFAAEGVRAAVHGRFQTGGVEHTIAKASPVSVFIPWEPDDDPEPGRFTSQLLSTSQQR